MSFVRQRQFVQPTGDPKNVTYQKDGTGRDVYISFNNGGVLKDQFFVTGGFERGQMPFKRHYAGVAIPSRSRMVHYLANGSGRDNYISCNAGGLSNMDQMHTLDGRRNFLTSLRHYQKMPTEQHKTLQHEEFVYPTFDLEVSKNRLAYVNCPQRNGRELQRFHRQRAISFQQRESVGKLSQPRSKEDPYEEFRTKTASFYKRQNSFQK